MVFTRQKAVLNMTRQFVIFILLFVFIPQAFAQSQTEIIRADFKAMYSKELGALSACNTQKDGEIMVCSKVLKNQWNAPFILVPSRQTRELKGVVVLLHGLSDSPFYLRSIAEHLQNNDYLAIVPLLPGHGKVDADADMQDPTLAQRWREHVKDVMDIAHEYSDNVFIGGFSAGGTLATDYFLNTAASDQGKDVKGLILFSGALQLSGSAESMSSIWGMKKLALWLDGDFKSEGPNPYRYPKVASYAGLLLMDVIEDIRTLLKDEKRIGNINTPIFAAHSLADALAPYEGVESLMASINGQHTEYKIDREFDVCHRDLVLSPVQMINFEFDKSLVNQSERCAVPKANPQYSTMLFMLSYFLKEHSVDADQS